MLVATALYPPLRGGSISASLGLDSLLRTLPLFGPIALPFAAFVWMLVGSLSGLHRLDWRWGFLAVFVAFLLTGLFFGHVNPPGDYGLHAIWRLVIENRGIRLEAGIGFD